MAKQKIELTQEQIQNIKSYNDQIETMEDLMAVIKLRPGMYIGRIGNAGFINMIREIFQNALDELIKADSPCNEIGVYFDEKDNTVIIKDNGRGIPYDNIVRVYTSGHTSSNFHKKDGEFSSGMHGTGSKAANALSSEFIVESYILGEGRRVEFVEGYPWKAGEKVIPNKNNHQGTIVEFRPNYTVMGEISITWKDVYELISKIVPLSKLGATVYFEALDKKGNYIKETIVNEDGIITDLIKKTTSPIIKPIIITRMTGQMTVEIAFTYDSDDLAIENITSFANMCPTVEGTHVNGMTNSICKFFADYMNKIYLANNKKLTIVRNDIKLGLKGIISVFHLNPIFTGQAKEIFSNNEMEGFVFKAVLDGLEVWSKNNPNDMQKLCKYFKDVAEIRVRSDKEKVKLTNNYKSSSITGFHSKYIKANGKTKLSLIIIEGDSAGGSADIGRDNNTQAVFPIRGKLPNALDTPRDKFLANEEISALITIFGAGYGRSFDIEKFEATWDMIIMAPDKDADGSHIRVLIVYFIIVYCPQIITHGHLYSAMPPLFGYKQGNKMMYFQDKLDFIKFVQQRFVRGNTVCDFKTGKKYTEQETTAIIYRNGDYTAELDRVSHIFAINPYLLEQIITFAEMDYKTFKNNIEKLYRFITVRQSNGIVIIEGLVEDKYQTVVVNEKMQAYLKPLIVLSKQSNVNYIVNDKPTTLYTLMKLFENSYPSGITRYKGLGEMDADQLGESTLKPGNRTLLKYTVDDVNKAIGEMREINSNKKLLLDAIGKISKDDIV